MPSVADLVVVVANAGWVKALFIAAAGLVAVWLWKRPSKLAAEADLIEAKARAVEADANADHTRARARWLDRHCRLDDREPAESEARDGLRQ